ncbi:unnamed protein product [Caenorhabditis angaria]|uniref:Uncharacterized protein n=1 Tax=Caenorhabditis angaria TaxID=860376 RepID=A0A9P1IXZ4_9PELO|nr:unnamed protein product [Caenorhabditis angaria]
MGEREVNLPQLFSDVSRTINGISNMMGGGESSGDGSGSTSAGGGTSGGSSIFGNTCFKACGMEDIQFAARSAGEMFNTIKFCVLMSTIVSLLILFFLSLAFCYYICSHNQNCSNCSNRISLPSFFKRVVPPPTTNSQK